MTHLAASAAMAPTKVPDPGTAPLGSNQEKSKVSEVVLDSHMEEPEGLPIDLGSEMNLNVNCTWELGQEVAEYMTQDTFNAFIDDDYTFKEGIQSTVDGLTMELWSIKELLFQTVPSQDPKEDHTPAQTLHVDSGPVFQTDGLAPSMSAQKNLPGPINQSEADDKESMERIPHYLKGKNLAKGTQENRNETNILSQGPPSEPSSEPPDNEFPRNDMRY